MVQLKRLKEKWNKRTRKKSNTRKKKEKEPKRNKERKYIKERIKELQLYGVINNTITKLRIMILITPVLVEGFKF